MAVDKPQRLVMSAGEPVKPTPQRAPRGLRHPQRCWGGANCKSNQFKDTLAWAPHSDLKGYIRNLRFLPKSPPPRTTSPLPPPAVLHPQGAFRGVKGTPFGSWQTATLGDVGRGRCQTDAPEGPKGPKEPPGVLGGRPCTINANPINPKTHSHGPPILV